jgi:uncharacterized protein (DUF433 family)
MAVQVDVSKYIEVRLLGQRPHIRGRRIPVAMIVQRAKANGWTVAETAYDFTISEAEVLAAMLYYEENRTFIEQQEIEEERLFNKTKHDQN